MLSYAVWRLQVNGILEAFVHASASPRQLVHINVTLVAFAAAHMALSVVLVRLGGALGVPFFTDVLCSLFSLSWRDCDRV